MRRILVSTMLCLACAPIHAGEGPAQGPAQAKKLDLLGDPLPPGAAARLGTIRFRHSGNITSTAWSPDGKLLGSAGTDEFIRLWDPATGKEVRRMKGAWGFRTPLVFFSDGKTLASGDQQGVIQLWDVATGREIRRFGKTKDPIQCLALSPDQDTLFSADLRGVRQWRVADGSEIRVLPPQQGLIRAMVVTDDGKELRTAAHGQPARVFEVATGKELRSFPLDSNTGLGYLPAMYSRNSRLLACARSDNKISIWDADNGKLIRLIANSGQAAALDFSANGKFVAITTTPSAGVIVAPPFAANHVHIFGVASGQEIRAFDNLARSTPGNTLAFAPDGQTLAVAGDYALRLWHVGDARETVPLPGSLSVVDSLCFSRDGSVVFTVAKGQALHVWDRASGKEIASASSRVTVMVAGTGPRNFFALSVGTGTEWSLLDGKLINKAQRWTPAGIFYNVMTASSDAKVAIVTRSEPGSELGITILDGPSGKIVTRLSNAKGAARPPVTFLAFSPDGKMLAASCSPAPIEVWNLATGRLIRELAKGGAPSAGKFAFSPDGKLLAVADQDIKFYEVATGQVRMHHALAPGAGFTTALTFSPDGRYMVVAVKKGGVQFFDVPGGAVVKDGQLGETLGVIRALAISPDGTTLATAGPDTSVLLWTKLPWRQPMQIAALPLKPAELDEHWRSLAQSEGQAVHKAIGALARAPKQSVPFLKARIKPAESVTPKQVEQYVRDLNSANFQIRQKATSALELLGDYAEGALRAELNRAPTLEVKRRIEGVLDKLNEVPLEKLRRLRALEALEYAGTDEARQVIATLAQGGAGHWLTVTARTALERLQHTPNAEGNK